MIVLTGMHRSGTTYLGEVLAIDESNIVIHEPFNRRYGIWGNPAVYLDGDNLYEDYIGNKLDKLLGRKLIRFKRTSSRDTFLKSLVRLCVGGKTERQWYKEIFDYHILNKKRRLVLKDPFLAMSAGALSKKNSVDLLFMVRHPGAIWSSIKAMGWTANISDFGGPYYFQCSDEYEILNSELSELETFCIMWREIYNRVLSHIEAGCFSGLLIKHEDLCERPLDIVKEVYKNIDCEVSIDVEDYVRRTTSASSAEKKHGTLHKFERDSKALLNSWRKKVSDEEQSIILEITGSVFYKIYEEW